MQPTELKRIMQNSPGLGVLHVTRPEEGDLFAFGTWEELENEQEAWEEDGYLAVVATAAETLQRVDFDSLEEDIEVQR